MTQSQAEPASPLTGDGQSTESQAVRRRVRRRRGFSLIEVLIVISLILVLGGLVAVTLFSRRDQADIDLTRVDMNTLNSALRQFRLDYRRYPTDEEGLAVLWDKEQLDPEADAAKYPAEGYLDRKLDTDRWGNEWGYRQVSENTEEEDAVQFDLWSFGPDGEDGTDDDITNWESDTEGGDDFEGLPPPPSGG